MITGVKEALSLEKSLHPKAEVQDYVKLVVQSCLGVAHLHIDEQKSLHMLEEEKKQDDGNETRIQYIGNGLCRVPLAYMNVEQLPFWNMLFLATWKHGKQSHKQVEDALAYLCEVYDVTEDLRKSAVQGVHHSISYKSAYRPCYRVMKYAYVQSFEVLFFIWKQMQTKSANHIGIDGRCASGKSTLCTLIAEVFSLQIFHMDDYFLPISLRSAKRLAQAGGNVDYERFEKEIIEPMMKGETTIYKRYDCQREKLGEKITVPYQSCTIWEGSYAHHPRFQKFLTARIFITCCEDIQRERLKKRSIKLFDRFVKDWIPMEETYFKTYSIQEQSDLVVDTSNYEIGGAIMNSTLIAYFSRRGENYVNGKIELLEIGNSEYIAKYIHKCCASDMFEIKCVDAYPSDYHETTKVADEEYKMKKRPVLTKSVEQMEAYDTIILGYPNWYGTVPMGVCTFLESYDFTNKKILPFCTHEGSGMAKSEQDIKRLCPTAQVVSGIAIKGSQVKDAHEQVGKWLDLNGVSCNK